MIKDALRRCFNSAVATATSRSGCVVAGPRCPLGNAESPNTVYALASRAGEMKAAVAAM